MLYFVQDMKAKIVLLCIVFFIGGAIIALIYTAGSIPATFTNIISPIGKTIEQKTRPLDAYTIEALSKRSFGQGEIEIGEAVATESAYLVYNFRYESDSKRISGLAHLPREGNLRQFPVVIQSRGYVPRESYQSGVGTRRSAEVYAANGFISLAPDFLGYGDSDNPSKDIFEERFQTYTALLNLYYIIRNSKQVGNGQIAFWGHSNGGQITLTALEIMAMKRQNGEDVPSVPATLWAPVTKPFPYSILYYTDEAEDRGKALRRKLSDFELLYDTDLFSMTNYLEHLRDPLQVHQGTSDDAVPQKWSDGFVNELKTREIRVTYYTYLGADHNLLGAWDLVVKRDIEFFRNNLD
jgi:dipeptidyl aminopeptidase/acylaminoacyl peptidase